MICRCFEGLRMDMKMEKYRNWLRCVKGVVGDTIQRWRKKTGGDGENRVIDEKQNDFSLLIPYSNVQNTDAAC